LTAPVLVLSKIWVRLGPETVLKDVSLVIEPGTVVVVWGRSGVGKTTLARVAALLERPSRGRVVLRGLDATSLGVDERARLRLRYIGYVDQYYTLAENLTAYENIELPLRLLGVGREERRRRVLEVAEGLGVRELLPRLPRGLSGGQRQRVALARALAKNPALLVLDEPFSSLDEETKLDAIRAIRGLAEKGAAILITTTDTSDLVFGDKCYRLRRGGLEHAECMATPS